MKHSIAALVLVLGFVTTSPGQQPKQSVTKDSVRKAIAVFRESHASERSRAAISIIRRFAEESPDVEVNISPAVLPWVGAEPPHKHTEILIAAYMAGTIRSQLDGRATKNDTVAGVEQVIETYQKLKKADPGLWIVEVEKFVDLKARGKLKEYFDAK